MSSLMNNTEKSRVTSKSVLEKLKSLSSNLSKNVTEKASDISSTIENEAISLTTKSNSNRLFNIFRYILIILLICFLLLNLLARFGLLSKSLSNFFNPILYFGHLDNLPKKATKQPITTLNKDTNKKSNNNKLSTIDAIENDIERDVKDLKDLVIPNSDDANSNIQNQKLKSGYCYVGEDRGYRSCVKVTEKQQCMSGDIFPTNDICINPTLRQ